MLVIRHAHITDPVTRREEPADIRIEGGVITAVCPPGSEPPEGAEILDGSGCVCAPGLVDTHVHFRDPGQTWKEDIFTGAAAAKRAASRSS